MGTSSQMQPAVDAAEDDMARLTCPDPAAVPHIQRLVVAAVARFHGVELHTADLGVADDVSASAAELAAWTRRCGTSWTDSLPSAARQTNRAGPWAAWRARNRQCR